MLHDNNIDILFPRAMSQVPCLHEHLANAAGVKYPAALLRCKIYAPSACRGVFDLEKASEKLRILLASLQEPCYSNGRDIVSNSMILFSVIVGLMLNSKNFKQVSRKKLI